MTTVFEVHRNAARRINRMTMIVACIVTAGLIWVAIDQLFSFLED
jgi:hypothetical protein